MRTLTQRRIEITQKLFRANSMPFSEWHSHLTESHCIDCCCVFEQCETIAVADRAFNCPSDFFFFFSSNSNTRESRTMMMMMTTQLNELRAARVYRCDRRSPQIQTLHCRNWELASNTETNTLFIFICFAFNLLPNNSKVNGREYIFIWIRSCGECCGRPVDSRTQSYTYRKRLRISYSFARCATIYTFLLALSLALSSSRSPSTDHSLFTYTRPSLYLFIFKIRWHSHVRGVYLLLCARRFSRFAAMNDGHRALMRKFYDKMVERTSMNSISNESRRLAGGTGFKGVISVCAPHEFRSLERMVQRRTSFCACSMQYEMFRASLRHATKWFRFPSHGVLWNWEIPLENEFHRMWCNSRTLILFVLLHEKSRQFMCIFMWLQYRIGTPRSRS